MHAPEQTAQSQPASRLFVLIATIGTLGGAGVLAGSLLEFAGTGLDLVRMGIAALFALAIGLATLKELPLGRYDVEVDLTCVPLLAAAVYLRPYEAAIVALVLPLVAQRDLLAPEKGRNRWLLFTGSCANFVLAVWLVSTIAHAWLGDPGGINIVHGVVLGALLSLSQIPLLLILSDIDAPGSWRDVLGFLKMILAVEFLLSSIGVVLVSPYMAELDEAGGLLHMLEAFAVMGAFLGVVFFFLQIANNEQRQRRRSEHLQQSFSRYVPEGVVSDNIDTMQKIELGGEQRQISVLFCDIRGFTTWAEKREPAEVIKQLNGLLSALSDAVFETGGTLDKFTGDGLMAFWGAPIALEDHADRACAAAQSMLARLESFNNARVRAGQEPFAIGVGVHSGAAVVGNVGHEKRLDYTAIGDTVNLAARVEAATKEVGSMLLITADTRAMLGADLAARSLRLGSIAVKGRQQEVEVFALGRPESARDELELDLPDEPAA